MREERSYALKSRDQKEMGREGEDIEEEVSEGSEQEDENPDNDNPTYTELK